MAMNAIQNKIQIELTPGQQAQIKRVLGREASVLDLTPAALEERVAPAQRTVTDRLPTCIPFITCIDWP
jgi:hypothetical protein